MMSNLWDQNCCKCIATRISGGNINFQSSSGYFGILGLSSQQRNLEDCGLKVAKDLCDLNNNLKCAEKLYK